MICQVTLSDCKNNCAGKCHFLTGTLSTPADEFAAMARDAERWRKFCSLDADVYINTHGWSFVGKGFGEQLARHLDLMAERNKEKS